MFFFCLFFLKLQLLEKYHASPLGETLDHQTALCNIFEFTYKQFFIPYNLTIPLQNNLDSNSLVNKTCYIYIASV